MSSANRNVVNANETACCFCFHADVQHWQHFNFRIVNSCIFYIFMYIQYNVICKVLKYDTQRASMRQRRRMEGEKDWNGLDKGQQFSVWRTNVLKKGTKNSFGICLLDKITFLHQFRLHNRHKLDNLFILSRKHQPNVLCDWNLNNFEIKENKVTNDILRCFWSLENAFLSSEIF